MYFPNTILLKIYDVTIMFIIYLIMNTDDGTDILMGEVAAPCAIQSAVDDSVVETTVDESAHDQPPLTVLEAAQDVVSAGHKIVKLDLSRQD